MAGSFSMALAAGSPERTPDPVGRPALLNDAFNALVEDQGRWAFTETQTGIRDDKPVGESIFRVDPSASYAEQHKPIKIRGKPPTEKQLKEAADRGERAAKRRSEQQSKGSEPIEADKQPKMRRADEVQLWINGQKVTPEIDRAMVTNEDETSVTYEIPMHPEGRNETTAMLEKFELTARVNKESHQFERATIRQRTPLRVKLIAKVSDTILVFEFSRPDPRFPSVPTKAIVDTRVRILLGKERVMHHEMVRTEFRHVTPYDERFGVKMGATRTIEF